MVLRCGCLCGGSAADDAYESTETATAASSAGKSEDGSTSLGTIGIKLNLSDVKRDDDDVTTTTTKASPRSTATTTTTAKKQDDLPRKKLTPRMFRDRSDPTERIYNSMRRSSASDLGRTLREGVQPEPGEDPNEPGEEPEAAEAAPAAEAPAAEAPAADEAAPAAAEPPAAAAPAFEAGWSSPAPPPATE